LDTSSTLRAVAPISPYQFAIFRVLFGLYLSFHFAHLAFYAPDLFAGSGSLPDATLNLTHGILPNPLEHWDSDAFVTVFVAGLSLLALLFAFGVARRTMAVLLWFGSACLFNRNNLISNPSLAYVGLMLLLSAVVPPGEPLTLRRGNEGRAWFFPAWVFRAAWIAMAVGYSYSGLDKFLSSPSWQDGTAITHVVNLPLARPGPLRDIVLALPESLRTLMTWCALALEVAFLPLALIPRLRPFVWTAAVGMHSGIIMLVSFADLSLGMLMLHLFTFDPRWFPAAGPSEHPRVVLYDGVCVLCNRSMQFLLQEDNAGLLSYAPLQGETAREVLARHPEIEERVSSVLYVQQLGGKDESVSTRSDAALSILRDLGGLWRVVSVLRWFPRGARDAIYDWVAANRYRWFGQYDACRLPDEGMTERFLD